MNFLITAGKTAGHINPAVSIINELKKDNNNKIFYVATKNSLESKLINKELLEDYIELNFFGTTKNPFKILKLIFLIIKNYLKMKKYLKKNKIDLIISTGGNLSIPIILAAKKLKIKSVIHEQNIKSGKTVKYLSKYVDKVFLSFKTNKDFFNENKIAYTGNPVSSLIDRNKNKSNIKYPENKIRILVTSGSLGAKNINETIKNSLELLQNYFLVWITGTKYYHEYEHFNSTNIIVLPYSLEMPSLLKEADLIISRAGASTITEIISVLKPSIIIPSPNVTNNHQEYNCNYLFDKHACIKINEKDLTPFHLLKMINKAFVVKQNIVNNLLDLNIKKSSEIFINECFKVIGNNNA